MTYRNRENITALIPAAGRVPEGILAFSNIVCPAMIPVGGRPLIYWTMRYLLGLGIKQFIIAVAQKQMFLEDFVACTFGPACHVKFLVPSADQGLGGTVRELAEAAETVGSLVVLGDTHFQFADDTILDANETTVLTHEVPDPYRWCTVEVNKQGAVEEFHDKSSSVKTPAQALIGVYYFPRTAELRDASNAAVNANRTMHQPTQMAQILQRLPGVIHTVPAREWLDCGNPDRQAASHQALLQKRAFNELSINPVLGTITKRSRHTDKFLDEINYLRLLPKDIAVLFPRVVDYSADWNEPYVTMEYYGYPTLAEVFVFENVDAGIWEQVFTHLRSIVLDEFGRYHRPLSAQVIRDMYLDKTRKRLAELIDHPVLGDLVHNADALIINGRTLANIPAVWDRIEERIDRLATNSQGTLVHGDLCLSNILYDLRCRVCKLIDPRGSFGTPGVYGDPRYDVAKMYHSVYGLYDLITNDLFDVKVNKSEISLGIRSRPFHHDVCARFERVFFSDFDRSDILLLTGLLFASMPALHYDMPKRQIAMYTRAVQLIHEALAPDTQSLRTK
jgi:dTDP-glucose pyrophosphorylase